MATLIYARRAVLDLDRLAKFLGPTSAAAAKAMALIADAVTVLARHPHIGRPVEDGMRELVISRGRTGYLALYDYYRREDLVVVLAIRHQREAGYVDAEE